MHTVLGLLCIGVMILFLSVFAEYRWGKDWRQSPLFLQAVRPALLFVAGQMFVLQLFIPTLTDAFFGGTVIGLIWGLICTTAALALAGEQPRDPTEDTKKRKLNLILVSISGILMATALISKSNVMAWLFFSTIPPYLASRVTLEVPVMPYYLQVLVSYLTFGLLSATLWFAVARHGLTPGVGAIAYGITIAGATSTWILCRRQQLARD